MSKKINSIQAIRALAFLGIFASHSDITVFAANGVWGVSVFLILSGFLMFLSYDGTDRITECNLRYCIRFGIKKIKRLYPLHIVMLLFAIPFLFSSYIGYGGINALVNPIIKTILNAALVQTWFPSSGIYFSLNAVSWYLSVSLFLYILFPRIIIWMKKYKGIKTAGIVITVIVALQMILAYGSYLIQVRVVHSDDFIHWFAYIFPISRLEEFVIGCNLGYIFKNSYSNKKISSVMASILEILLFFIRNVNF